MKMNESRNQRSIPNYQEKKLLFFIPKFKILQIKYLYIKF